jgi:hydroxymethylpyrimidine/phosphomethylpyrimidine kinase
MAHTPPFCLSIGASVCSGVSGIQVDLKTFTALSCCGAAVVTSVVAQSTRVLDLTILPEHSVRAQLDAVDGALPVSAVKVGFLPTVAVVRMVSRWLREHPRLQVVVDPCAVDGRGIPLHTPEVIAALRDELLPRATVVVPNRFEAALLANMEEVVGHEDMEEAARVLLHLYGAPVLVTGGGLADGSTDVLVSLDGLNHFNGATLGEGKVPGSGATHSSAITAGLAKGESLREAVMGAKLFTTAAIAAAPALGPNRPTVWHAVTVREQVILERSR